MSESIIRSVASEIFRNQLTSSVDGWVGLETTRGETIAKLREYTEGEHDAKLTTYMRRALRIGPVTDTSTGHAPWATSTAGGGISTFDEMHANYMGVIIQAAADRLTLEGVMADNDAASEWAKDIVQANRLDGFQMDVHEAALRDGDTYVMVDWDKDTGRLRWTHEPAYDGTSGIVSLYASRKMILAIRIWHVVEDTSGEDVSYVNVYYPDRIEKFIANAGGAPRPRPLAEGEKHPNPRNDEHVFDWKARDGSPLGIPLIHFRNRATTYGTHGKSEISDAIPLQNALNRTIYSMIMAAELTAFQVRVATGFTPPAGLAPGDIITVSKTPLNRDQVAGLTTLEQGDIMPYIEEARHLKAEIFDVTNTPQRDDVSSSASGERLKQQEVGLLGKLKRFQTKAGNSWEDVLDMSARVQTAFSNDRVPAYERFTAQWAEVELRNDTEVLHEAREDYKAGVIDHRTYLETVASIRGWDKTKIDEIIERTRNDRQQNFADLAGSLPGIGDSFTPSPNGGGLMMDGRPTNASEEEAA